MQRVGVLTSGGDCQGLNAAIRALTLRCLNGYNIRVFGIHDGTSGLIRSPLEVTELNETLCDVEMLRSGGTILGSNRKESPFNFPMGNGVFEDCSDLFYENFKTLGLEALVAIGGDGSLRSLHTLCQKYGIPIIGIPKTIDNDIGLTENAIGHQTASMIATEALDRLQPTAASHQRVMVLEVMGRDAGHIALNSGIAGGADVILIPEIPYNFEYVCHHLQRILQSKRKFALVVVAEAVKTPKGEAIAETDERGRPRYGGVGTILGSMIEQCTGADTRVTVLGHVQRGGQPCLQDRVLASAFGVRAADLLAQNIHNRLIIWRDRHVCDVPIEQAYESYQAVNPEGTLVRTARGLGISFGDSF
jgi:6-phosphofructokinase 1